MVLTGGMNKVFEYNNGKVKVMYNEIPFTKDYDEEWKEWNVEHHAKFISVSFLLGIEVMRHVGGRMCYGMLSARIQPCEEADCVKVSIAFTEENTIKYKDALLLDDTYVYKGLPKEYVDEVGMNIVRAISNENNFPQCHISIEYAANCEVGSSICFYEIIVEIIMGIIGKGAPERIFTMDREEFSKCYLQNSLRWRI